MMPVKSRLLRSAGVAIVIAAGLRAWYAAAFERNQFAAIPHAPLLWALIYAAFGVAYLALLSDTPMRTAARRAVVLATASVTSVALVLLYPNFLTTCLLVVVIWHLTLATNLRVALVVTALQSGVLALEKCTGATNVMAMSWLVLIGTLGFQLFAMAAAQLVRNEIDARNRLARANAELEAAQDLLRETAAFGERLRIARDLHDILGHGLTVLTIQLDLAARQSDGALNDHLTRTRAIAAGLLDQVRAVVGEFRQQTIDVRAALLSLAQNTGDLDVRIAVPDDLRVDDTPRAEALVRCVQETITNALRHADARTLNITVVQNESEIYVEAKDDGHAAGSIIEGAGLRGLRERFAQLGGAVSIESRDDGFQLWARMPSFGPAK